MTRARLIVFFALAAAVGLVRSPSARRRGRERAGKRLVYLFVSGKGRRRRPRYDGGPPSGSGADRARQVDGGGLPLTSPSLLGVAATVNLSSSTASPPPRDAGPAPTSSCSRTLTAERGLAEAARYLCAPCARPP